MKRNKASLIAAKVLNNNMVDTNVDVDRRHEIRDLDILLIKCGGRFQLSHVELIVTN